MKKKLLSGIKFAVQTALVFLLVSLFLDWIRKPDEPAGAAGRPLTLLSGQRLTLGQFSRDKAVLVYFWGSWCGVCRYQSPIIDDLAADGVPVVGVAVRSGSSAEVAAYMAKRGLGFPTANDEDGDLARSWRIVATPAVVLVKNGKMVHYTTGISSYWGLRARIFQADVFG
ncbi:TPA: protein disulfide oxidoreductase [Neisseria meningitidis]|uniref:Protein disulfide oxidoreductase n=2 Tax=Neisseria meningitidis TaxID=487 RepID=A0AB37K5Q6_NEIME|nr:protein disulfide oxidoreductase [Neisseria meningitidis]MBG8972708.1 redoxin family protein [Neisseria meningitidis]MBG9010669.1 redoxin family protein [Neisseria meningitidis]MBG9038731.1 redoxin family protein [Neisseria meningitidis]MCV6775535.1 protein disulfide oxidoreductase [Neisseria meningitidis]RGA47240.1 protein disulfide oxidoreductase [Neisseria meningitidis]